MGAHALEASQDPLSGQPETIRAFLGIGLPQAQREVLASYVAACRGPRDSLRWVSPGNLHLTLRFLGAVAPARIEGLTTGLRRLRFSSFEVRLGGLRTFGRGRAVRVLWLGVEVGAAELTGLAGQAEEACRRVGLTPEPRPFNPHLTLARARERSGVDVLELPPLPAVPSWRVEEIALFQSLVTPAGAIYSVLRRFGG